MYNAGVVVVNLEVVGLGPGYMVLWSLPTTGLGTEYACSNPVRISFISYVALSSTIT
jgi:hypothetical protein